MYILGELVELAEDEVRIPLPWWNRAPLAFETDTQVSVAITHRSSNRVGELLVSVLEPQTWDVAIRLRCSAPDQPGVIARAFSVIAREGWNIALAEAVTRSATDHAVELILEPDDAVEDVGQARDRLLRALAADDLEASVLVSIESGSTDVAWSRTGMVEDGWVTFGRHSEVWRDILQQQAQELGDLGRTIDLNRFVVSADTENRVLRFVFPRDGAQTFNVEHRDVKGTLAQIAEALADLNLNVLSLLLKRGGAAPGNAVAVTTCEPDPADSTSSVEVHEAFRQRMRELDPLLQVDLREKARPNFGRKAQQVIYVRHKDDIVNRVPEELEPRVTRLREQHQGRKPVFVSRRFAPGTSVYSRQVHATLRSHGLLPVEAPPHSGKPTDTFGEVSARMWACSAAIVLVADLQDAGVAFGLNLAHEFGFFQGQNKPILVLVEDSVKVIRDLELFTNTKGTIAPRFSGIHFDDPSQPDSIPSQVRLWLMDAGFLDLAEVSGSSA